MGIVELEIIIPKIENTITFLIPLKLNLVLIVF